MYLVKKKNKTQIECVNIFGKRATRILVVLGSTFSTKTRVKNITLKIILTIVEPVQCYLKSKFNDKFGRLFFGIENNYTF